MGSYSRTPTTATRLEETKGERGRRETLLEAHGLSTKQRQRTPDTRRERRFEERERPALGSAAALRPRQRAISSLPSLLSLNSSQKGVPFLPSQIALFPVPSDRDTHNPLINVYYLVFTSADPFMNHVQNIKISIHAPIRVRAGSCAFFSDSAYARFSSRQRLTTQHQQTETHLAAMTADLSARSETLANATATTHRLTSEIATLKAEHDAMVQQVEVANERNQWLHRT